MCVSVAQDKFDKDTADVLEAMLSAGRQFENTVRLLGSSRAARQAAARLHRARRLSPSAQGLAALEPADVAHALKTLAHAQLKEAKGASLSFDEVRTHLRRIWHQRARRAAEQQRAEAAEAAAEAAEAAAAAAAAGNGSASAAASEGGETGGADAAVAAAAAAEVKEEDASAGGAGGGGGGVVAMEADEGGDVELSVEDMVKLDELCQRVPRIVEALSSVSWSLAVGTWHLVVGPPPLRCSGCFGWRGAQSSGPSAPAAPPSGGGGGRGPWRRSLAVLARCLLWRLLVGATRVLLCWFVGRCHPGALWPQDPLEYVSYAGEAPQGLLYSVNMQSLLDQMRVRELHGIAKERCARLPCLVPGARLAAAAPPCVLRRVLFGWGGRSHAAFGRLWRAPPACAQVWAAGPAHLQDAHHARAHGAEAGAQRGTSPQPAVQQLTLLEQRRARSPSLWWPRQRQGVGDAGREAT